MLLQRSLSINSFYSAQSSAATTDCSTSPRTAPLPEPTSTTSPRTTATALPEPNYTTSPHTPPLPEPTSPRAALLPDPTCTTNPRTTAVSLSGPTPFAPASRDAHTMLTDAPLRAHPIAFTQTSEDDEPPRSPGQPRRISFSLSPHDDGHGNASPPLPPHHNGHYNASPSLPPHDDGLGNASLQTPAKHNHISFTLDQDEDEEDEDHIQDLNPPLSPGDSHHWSRRVSLPNAPHRHHTSLAATDPQRRVSLPDNPHQRLAPPLPSMSPPTDPQRRVSLTRARAAAFDAKVAQTPGALMVLQPSEAEAKLALATHAKVVWGKRASCPGAQQQSELLQAQLLSEAGARAKVRVLAASFSPNKHASTDPLPQQQHLPRHAHPLAGQFSQPGDLNGAADERRDQMMSRLQSLVLDQRQESDAHEVQLQHELQARESEVGEMQSELLVKGGQLELLQYELAELRLQQASQLEQLQAAGQLQLDRDGASGSELEQLRCELEQLRGLLQERDGQVGELRSEVEQWAVGDALLQGELQERDRQLDQLQFELQQREISELLAQSDLLEHGKQLGQLQAELLARDSQLDQLQVQLRQVQSSQLDQLQPAELLDRDSGSGSDSQLQQLQLEIQQWQAKEVQMQCELKACGCQVAQLQASLAQMQSEHRQRGANEMQLQVELQARHAQLAQLQGSVVQLQLDRQQQEASNVLLQSELQTRDSQLAQLQATLAQLQLQQQQAEASQAQLQLELQARDVQLVQLQSEQQQRDSQEAQVEASFDEFQQCLVGLQTQLHTWQDAAHVKVQQVQALAAVVETSTAQSQRRLVEQVECLQAMVALQEADSQDQSARLEALRHQVSHQVASQEGLLEELQRISTEQQSNLQAINEQLQELDSERTAHQHALTLLATEAAAHKHTQALLVLERTAHQALTTAHAATEQLLQEERLQTLVHQTIFNASRRTTRSTTSESSPAPPPHCLSHAISGLRGSVTDDATKTPASELTEPTRDTLEDLPEAADDGVDDGSPSFRHSNRAALAQAAAMQFLTSDGTSGTGAGAVAESTELTFNRELLPLPGLGLHGLLRERGVRSVSAGTAKELQRLRKIKRLGQLTGLSWLFSLTETAVDRLVPNTWQSK